jgi:sulfoxide reductase catalytic subunit YedY
VDHVSFSSSFPLWLRINHWVNFLFLTLLMRSGIQILFDLPKLYFNDHCTPGTEWLKFTRKKLPDNKLWTSHEEAEWVSPLIALPGGFRTAGTARSWHFFSVIFWVLNGFVYVTLLFLCGEWQRLIPVSWDIVPRAFHTFLTFASFHLPAASEYRPYDPLQQLAYAAVVFILAPLAMLTGCLQSPAIDGRFPRLLKALGGRQSVRSIHFLILCCYVLFLIIHVSLVVITDFAGNMNHMVLGINSRTNEGIVVGLAIIFLVGIIHYAATLASNKYPRKVQHTIGHFAEFFISHLLNRLRSCQQYQKSEISKYFRVNGYPPTGDEWLKLKESGFRDYNLTISGLVENPLSLSLAQIKNLPKHTQITKHHCVQGWTAIAEWGGVPIKEILSIVKPLPAAKFLLFRTFQFDQNGQEFYGTITIDDANQDQTLLAYEMNGQLLPEEYGAPLRLRVETYVGFKMTKWIKAIEVLDDYSKIFEGQGGYREDQEYHVNLPKA